MNFSTKILHKELLSKQEFLFGAVGVILYLGTSMNFRQDTPRFFTNGG
jgi:hypothetical protein